jgi:hypothetical protein
MTGQVTISKVMLPGAIVGERAASVGQSIEQFVGDSGWALKRQDTGWDFKLPTVCARNGLPVLRRDWPVTTIGAGDVIVFVARPYGGGVSGKSVAGILATIALAAIAPWAGGVVAGAFFSGSALVGGLVAGAISAGGRLWRCQIGASQATADNPADTGSDCTEPALECAQQVACNSKTPAVTTRTAGT